MNARERREQVLTRLMESQKPLSATALARQFSVSRQIIVGDIALLRAGGQAIDATPRGYLLRRQDSGLVRTIAVQHGPEDTERELTICVDNGCVVQDVIVEHPLYGQITAQLRLHSRYEVQQFLQQCQREQAAPLSRLTRGVHLHTLSCPDQESYERVCAALEQAGILLKENDLSGGDSEGSLDDGQNAPVLS